MFKRIVVPLDGTRFAEAALAPARELARRFGAHIVVMYAVSPSRLPRTISQDRSVEAQVELERINEADGYLNGITQSLKDAGYDASFLLFVAEPGAGIPQAAELDHADLIVMATHRHWTLNLTRSDSTTLQVLTRSNVPILSWRPGATLEQEKSLDGAAVPLARPESPIVVPLDGSEVAERALPVAEELARAFDSSLILVRAVGHARMQIGAGAGEATGVDKVAQADRALQEAQAYLDHIAEGLRGRGVPARGIAREGTPPSVIDAARRENDAALITMASHGSRGATLGFLGSVAGAMVEEGEAPVLVVRA